MGDDAPSIDDINNFWIDLHNSTQERHDRVNAVDGWAVPPLTALGRDDELTYPYQLSHAVHSCLVMGVDHVHALCTLVVDQGIMHVAAPATLARGAIEVASAGLWMLSPRDRVTRVRRLLAWHAQNLRDGIGAATTLGAEVPDAPEVRSDLLLEIADRAGVPPDWSTWAPSSKVAKVAGEYLTAKGSRINNLAAWQLASGFAHGRPWVVHTVADRDETDSTTPGVTNATVTANFQVMALLARAAQVALDSLMELFEARATPPHTVQSTWPTGASVPDAFSR
ncbi:hypothetical protein [Solicola gregarius]|uniref:Uncharacterized protein n=1 Tax=Solicola gregarius TaxID=2908642 RepID=A0AA46TEQ8_9ACTN|nr:hypothetical protein [Solicola gregarius]UYM03452.1 hypothetical protein L0C25_12885 [Solicola gregarius]